MTTKMTGRERIRRAFARQAVDRTPWAPFVGCHAGALMGLSAEAYLKSAQAMVQGVQAAINQYRPDGIPVCFDLQIEAEALGCGLTWAPENPPAVNSHPLNNGTTIDQLHIPGPTSGRIGLVLDVTRQLRQANPDIALYGLVTGPFTLALHLLGTNIFMKMFDDPGMVEHLMTFCENVCIAMSGYYLEAGCDVIAVVDPMTSQIGPDQFYRFVTPYAKRIFSAIRERKGLSSFFVCGHAEQNLAAMCECGPDGVSVDENISLEYARDVCLPRHVSFGGNMQLTTVLLLGSPEDAQRNALACMDIAGDTGFILSPGCDLPYATPPKNLEAVIKVLEDPYQRDVIRTMAARSDAGIQLDMSEYGQYDKVVVDIITIDSEACAPCQYMVDSVRQIAPEFEGIVEWREHKIKYRESLVFMTSLMVRNVPTICIDGQIKFVSRIPPRDELIQAIQQRINEKFRLGIKRRQGMFYLLGGESDEQTRLVRQNIEQAITELGNDIQISSVTDEAEMAMFGLVPRQTPAVIVARYQLKSTRRVPDVSIVKEWIKDML